MKLYRPHLGSPRRIQPGQKIHSSLFLESGDKTADVGKSKLHISPYVPKAIPKDRAEWKNLSGYWEHLREDYKKSIKQRRPHSKVEVDLYDDIHGLVSSYARSSNQKEEEVLLGNVARKVNSGTTSLQR